MRNLNTQEIAAVTGAGKIDIAAVVTKITAALAAKGITFTYDKTAGTLTVVTPKGTNTYTLPKLPVTA